MANTSKASPMGTCRVCGERVAWPCSTLDRHPAPDGADGSDPSVVLYMATGSGAAKQPAHPYPGGHYVCAGSYKPPTEADVPARPMTADERRLSRKLMG